MALTLSIIALLATFYQLYLQRRHNEKSLKPLVQIDLKDRDRIIAVYVQNNGLGPFIIEKLTFVKDGQIYHSIAACLSFDPKTYHNVSITETAKKVILPGDHLDIFSVRFAENDKDEYVSKVRQELSVLKLKVDGRDIYNNRIVIERDLNWFVSYAISDKNFY